MRIAIGSCIFSTVVVFAQTPADETQQLRKEIQVQRENLEAQQRKLDELTLRLEALEHGKSTASPKEVAQVSPPHPTEPPQPPQFQRDPVGDLNADKVRAGEMPGSILLPGKEISLAIGGFVKALAFYDTNAEGRGAVFFPATLGSVRDDLDGGSAITAELSRLTFDARSRFKGERFRGYIEFDFNSGNFKLRHAYLTWDAGWGQILAGQYWSSFMDIQTLPESLSEPVFSGAVFARQGQVRYTRVFAGGKKWTIAIEDPESNDVQALEPLLTRTPWPDVVSTFSVNGESAHFQIGALVRGITVDTPNEPDFGLTGYGVHTSGYLKVGEHDKLSGDFVFGRGIGRYVLGLTPGGSAFVIPENREIFPRNVYGGFATVLHGWNQSCRSTTGVGYVYVETDAREPDDALQSSLYGMANLVCSVSRYMTVGGEYVYGQRWNRVSALNNNRITFGLQVF